MPRPVLAAALAALAALAGAVRADEPPAPTPPAAAPAATPVPEPEAPPDEATRSEPVTGATPAGTAGGHRKGGVAAPASPRPTPLYTVLEIVPGRSLSVRAPDGHALVFDLTKKTKLPAGLVLGSSVTIRAKASGKRRVATDVRLAEPPAAAVSPPPPPPSPN